MSRPVITLTSPDSTIIIYACGHCRSIYAPVREVPGLPTPSAEQQAIECCVCLTCGGPRDRGKYFWTCQACADKETADKETARRAALAELPVVEDDGGPVYVDDWDEYFEDLASAAEQIRDDLDLDPESVIVHPCTVRKVPTPDLVETVEEAWNGEFEDAADWMSTELVAALVAVQKQAEEAAPNSWHPRTDVRLAIEQGAPDA